MMEPTPVYICTGFLDSGKTLLVKDTLMEQEWIEPGLTLLILCEEGEEEYSKEYLEAGKNQKAHEALRSGSEILAGTCMDILEHPEFLQKMKEEFEERKRKEQMETE